MLVLVFSETVLIVGSVFCLTEFTELIDLTIVCWPPVGPQDIAVHVGVCERMRPSRTQWSQLQLGADSFTTNR